MNRDAINPQPKKWQFWEAMFYFPSKRLYCLLRLRVILASKQWSGQEQRKGKWQEPSACRNNAIILVQGRTSPFLLSRCQWLSRSVPQHNIGLSPANQGEYSPTNRIEQGRPSGDNMRQFAVNQGWLAKRRERFEQPRPHDTPGQAVERGSGYARLGRVMR